MVVRLNKLVPQVKLYWILFAFFTLTTFGQEHPSLILTKAGVEKIRAQLGSVPIFDASLKKVKDEVDAEISWGIDTPIPKDFSGGYTHERHKKNFLMLQKSGVLFQILQEDKYAIYIRDMLFQYEEMYKTLPLHPQQRSYARGKLFWQCLNDSNWLVYVSQAYDCIYDWLSKKERLQLENNLFRPLADFISIGNPQFYNRIHNHSTWGNVAVGMIGLVMNDNELVQRALYGLKDDNLEIGAKDDDGGFLKIAGQKAGFLANLDEPFSPEGYYTEGPYYQRYAMYPFLIFAQALHNLKPELRIFDYKDSVLIKSVHALINLSDADGDFFPINDGQKGMSYYSRELVTAVDIAYNFGGKDPKLLSMAKKQNEVVLDDAGLSVAIGLRDNMEKPFIKNSVNLTDGPNGKQGGVAILRYGEEDLAVAFKYSAQGLSHGHYDKLSFSMYDKGDEVIQDYGLTRFVNIEHKGGGNYLKENTSWAKQTIAHNTLIQNETSHFNGSYEIGSKYSSELYLYDDSDKGFQIISAKEKNAYPDTEMHRTMSMISIDPLDKAFVLDIMRVVSDNRNQYDFPYYYMGQIMNVNFDYVVPDMLTPLGTDNGYQHLWKEGEGSDLSENVQFTWLNQGKFYTLTTVAQTGDNIIFARLGANDPDFNLRRDASFMLRRNNAQNTLFVSILEPHGFYSAVSEFAVDSFSKISNLKVVYDGEDYTAVSFSINNEADYTFILSNTNVSRTEMHQLNLGGEIYRWQGPYYFKNN